MLKEDQLYYNKFFAQNELQSIVKYGWVMKSEEIFQSDLDFLIPDGYPEIIFVLKGAYAKKLVIESAEPTIIENSCVVGIQSQTILASRINKCHLLGLKLYPWGAYRIFGEQLRETANGNIDIAQFGLKWLYELNIKLGECEDESEMIELVCNALSKQVISQKTDVPWKRAKSFIESILLTKGQISVRELADQECLSIRHFQRKFKQFYGVSPKKLINIIRFKHLYKSCVLQQKIPVNFLEYGYYDQMHFIKDYQKQLGITPSKTLEQVFLKRNQMAKINV